MVYLKKCVICDKTFETTYRSKNVCSFSCRQEKVRENSREIMRRKRFKRRWKTNIRPPCQICGFSETIDKHREGGKVYYLCPNHHALITRGIRTFEELRK